jgi:Carboxypeptidase regulatory-like domain
MLRLPCFELFLLLSLTTPLSARRPQADRRIPEHSPATTATVQGVIRDSQGRGIPGVQLDLRITGNGTGIGTASGQHYSVTTNVEGIFRLRDVRLGVYEVKLTGEGFEAQVIPSFQVIHPVSVLELVLKASSEAIPAAQCPSGVPGIPCVATPAGPMNPYPGLRSPASEATPASPEQIPPASANFSPSPDRWDIAMPDWRRYETQPDAPYVKGHWYDPFNRNKIKGDYPIFGQQWFFNFTGTSETGFDGRRLPTPSGLSSDPGDNGFFGRGEQAFVSENLRLSFDLFRGDTSFRPVDFRVRITPEINLNFLQTRERGIVNVDTRKGTNRFDSHVGLQEAFVEAKIHDLSPNYDFVSVRAGIQQFTSDFRGFIFSEEQPGVRVFGNLRSNRFAYNVAWFDLLEKNTNSGLNTFHKRGQ